MADRAELHVRTFGIDRLLRWRWASCAALVAGACLFVVVALLVIPERIGEASLATDARSGSSPVVPLVVRPKSTLAPSVPAEEAIAAPAPPTGVEQAPSLPTLDPTTDVAEEAPSTSAPTSIPIGPVRPEDD